MISDVLPKSFKYVSSSPQLVAPITNFTNGYWRLEYENIYYDTISFELKDGTGNILAQKAQ
ncbi:MAG: hypothetical protein LBP53_07715 [Candidatus Peribacteria bacterium]|nr:hypothetical protein [Candidatus Peribacteria bacterium]